MTFSPKMSSLDYDDNPLVAALEDHRVSASVVDLDHRRIRGGMVVETDYIIRVQPNLDVAPKDNEYEFEGFLLSKTYRAFRLFSQQLKRAADLMTANEKPENLPKKVQILAKYAETVYHLIETQRTQYIGKVNYNYVKILAKKRCQIINETLEATLTYFPDEIESHPFLAEISQIVETFFLNDHCQETDDPAWDDNSIVLEESEGSENGGIECRNKREFGHKRVPSGAMHKETPTKCDTQHSLTSTKSNGSSPVPFKLDEAAGKLQSFMKNKFSGDDGDSNTTSTISSGNKITPLGSAPKAPSFLGIDTCLTNAAGSSRRGSALTVVSPVVPYSTKLRKSSVYRALDEDELNEVGMEAILLLDDEHPPSNESSSRSRSSKKSTGSKIGDIFDNHPMIFVYIVVSSLVLIRYSALFTISMGLDIQMLLLFASYCIGWHTPCPMKGEKDASVSERPKNLSERHTSSGSTDKESIRSLKLEGCGNKSVRLLLRRSMATSPEAQNEVTTSKMDFSDAGGIVEDEEGEFLDMHLKSPLPQFPPGAELGSQLNCWSLPVASNFQIRGPDYLSSKKKIPSEQFLFPVRGVDLFLTDACPENAGSIAGVFGGNLRDLPTFIINFRLPWGILLAYFEIPSRFLPFLKAGYEPDFDVSTLPSLDNMPPSDRCVARWLKGSNDHKNKTLKIVPMVVQGPWVVKSVVGGKPAIIGNKLPVTYCYQKEEMITTSDASDKEPTSRTKACYLEADLDIVASSAARGILSVARTYTQVLTIDLGFVVQGDLEDELPEQMLVGARLHGIDPHSAPELPISKDMFSMDFDDLEDDESTR